MATKEIRLQQLMEHTDHWSHVKNAAYEGKVVKVLVDGPSKKNKEVYSGYTETNKLINFAGEGLKTGDIVDVLVTKAKSWSLDGELIKK